MNSNSAKSGSRKLRLNGVETLEVTPRLPGMPKSVPGRTEGSAERGLSGLAGDISEPFSYNDGAWTPAGLDLHPLSTDVDDVDANRVRRTLELAAGKACCPNSPDNGSALNLNTTARRSKMPCCIESRFLG